MSLFRPNQIRKGHVNPGVYSAICELRAQFSLENSVISVPAMLSEQMRPVRIAAERLF